MSPYWRAEDAMGGETGKALIVVGPGERLEELAAALGGLVARSAGGTVRLVGIEDLAQLLLLAAPAGQVLLDGDLVPDEDLGILRRFLGGRAGWSLLVVGDDERTLSQRGLFGLSQSRFLRWPPDLSTLRSLAGALASPSAAPAAPAPELVPLPPTALRTSEPTARPKSAPTPASNGAVDLGSLLDDLIVGRAVQETGADYDFPGAADLRVACDRAEASAVLDGFLALADACAGPDQRVEVRARATGRDARVELSFPPGPLTDIDLPALLGEGPFQGPRELRQAVEGAREARELVASLRGRATLGTARAGRLLLALELPLATQG
jgi:hypothetical protein